MINSITYFPLDKNIGPITLKIALSSAICLVITEPTCSSSYIILQSPGRSSAQRFSRRSTHTASFCQHFHGSGQSGEVFLAEAP